LFRYADYLFFNERYSESNRFLEECLKLSECKARGEIIKKGIERLQSSQDPVSNTDVWLDVSRSLAEVDTAEAKEVQVPQDKMELVSKDLKEVETQNESQGYVPTEVEADRLNIVQSYEVDWELELAANGYERLINDHPDSPFTQLAYVRFLVRQGKMEQALSRVSFVEDSYPSFRNEPEWLILTQTLTSQKTLSPFEVDLKIANQLRDRRANLNQIGIALSEPLFPPTALSEK
jgi:hypothetical protein